MKTFDPASSIQDLQYFGEFGGVNPSIEDSSTYTFLKAEKMEEIFEKEMEGCYLYSRHWNPTNRYLSQALAKMENTEAAIVTASGMSAITCSLLQICGAGDEIVCSRMVYGGTYAFLKNVAPRYGITSRFVDINKLSEIENAITKKTKVVYCETMSNPMLEVADLPAISAICKRHDVLLMVDNTFTPLLVTPTLHGADVVVHSLTKFINGTSDTVAGAICASKKFIESLVDVNHGTAMLLGPVMDSMRAASVLKNLHSLQVRMQKHSSNALYLAQHLKEEGVRVIYPGLTEHPQHEVFNRILNSGYGYGGMLVIDMYEKQQANQLMECMQEANVGYLAVSLGFYKTLFSAPGSSTSSEIPEEERLAMGLSDGLIRMSVGLDAVINVTFSKIMHCMNSLHVNLI
ncbi:MAG TPA: aminotransferase class I/II-fold pyridoxal phosphate-dependent enzyme [Cyclobacteriaceae bacterium]|nr:aminotransferase class I/II-fold pyridoxal phosphate-dependent enzyme [Cyclobacteriaceae bacterium]